MSPHRTLVSLLALCSVVVAAGASTLTLVGAKPAVAPTAQPLTGGAPIAHVDPFLSR